MRILVMMGERRTSRSNPVWEAARVAARSLGAEVEIAFADERLWRPRELAREYDGFVLKSRSPIWLNLAAGLSAYTARMVNPYHSSLRVLNKYEATSLLEAAGVAVPASWIAGAYPPPSPAGRGAVVLKKVYGHRGDGVRILPRVELDTLEAEPREHFLQEVVRGQEIKVKVLGSRVGAFRRRLSPGEYVVGDLLPVTDEIRALAIQVGEILGLTMYGMDVMQNEAGLHVIDVNLIPSYRQFPEWAGELAAALVEVGAAGRA